MPATTTRMGNTVTAMRAILLSASSAGLTGVPSGELWGLVASSIQSWWHCPIGFRQLMTGAGNRKSPGAVGPAPREQKGQGLTAALNCSPGVGLRNSVPTPGEQFYAFV